MDKKNSYLQQGSAFPPSGKGVGVFFLFLPVFLVIVFKDYYWILLFSYIFFWIYFAKVSLNLGNIKNGIITKRIGFFPIYYSEKINLLDYDSAIVKRVDVAYRTTQSTGIFVLSSQKNKDTFLSIQLKRKNSYAFTQLLKGNRKELYDFIKTNLKDTHLRFYKGVPRPEYEFKI